VHASGAGPGKEARPLITPHARGTGSLQASYLTAVMTELEALTLMVTSKPTPGSRPDPGKPAGGWSARTVPEPARPSGPPSWLQAISLLLAIAGLGVSAYETYAHLNGSHLAGGRPHRFRAREQPARLLLIAVPGGIEDYFRQINNAATDEELRQIGEQYGIRVVPE
jgi:hypothetical protein